MFCLRYWLPLFIFVPYPIAPPYVVFLFILSMAIQHRPCLYCATLWGAIVVSTSGWDLASVDVSPLVNLDSPSDTGVGFLLTYSGGASRHSSYSGRTETKREEEGDDSNATAGTLPPTLRRSWWTVYPNYSPLDPLPIRPLPLDRQRPSDQLTLDSVCEAYDSNDDVDTSMTSKHWLQNWSDAKIERARSWLKPFWMSSSSTPDTPSSIPSEEEEESELLTTTLPTSPFSSPIDDDKVTNDEDEDVVTWNLTSESPKRLIRQTTSSTPLLFRLPLLSKIWLLVPTAPLSRRLLDTSHEHIESNQGWLQRLRSVDLQKPREVKWGELKIEIMLGSKPASRMGHSRQPRRSLKQHGSTTSFTSSSVPVPVCK